MSALRFVCCWRSSADLIGSPDLDLRAAKERQGHSPSQKHRGVVNGSVTQAV